MVKTYVAEALGEIVDKALQVFGGWGYTADWPLERWYRDARAARIYDGPSEVHRMLVARRLFREVIETGGAAAPRAAFLPAGPYRHCWPRHITRAVRRGRPDCPREACRCRLGTRTRLPVR
jgi:hypothetical protein